MVFPVLRKKTQAAIGGIYNKIVLKNSAKFTGKPLHQSVFFKSSCRPHLTLNKVAFIGISVFNM